MGTDERDGPGQARADGRDGVIDDGKSQDYLTIKTELGYGTSQNSFETWVGGLLTRTE